MLIDWFTVGAQIVNFVVLVWFLKRFLYRPILSALAKREQTIAANLETAAATKSAAESERLLFERKNLEFEHKASELLTGAEARAEQERQLLLDKARVTVEAQQIEWERALLFERETFFEQLGQQVQQQVFSITQRLVQELAAVDLEEQMISQFINRLESPEAASKTELVDFMQKIGSQLVVRGAFEFSEKSKQLISAVLQQKKPLPLEIVFQHSPELICGIELFANGRKISWTMTQYLSELRHSVEALVERRKEAKGAEK